MKQKDKLFQLIAPWASWYRSFKWLAIAQFILTLVLPIVFPELDTGVWLLSFACFAFWLSSYALVRLAHHHQPDKRGLTGWLINIWENILVLTWFVILLAILFLFFKLATFMWSN